MYNFFFTILLFPNLAIREHKIEAKFL